MAQKQYDAKLLLHNRNSYGTTQAEAAAILKSSVVQILISFSYNNSPNSGHILSSVFLLHVNILTQRKHEPSEHMSSR